MSDSYIENIERQGFHLRTSIEDITIPKDSWEENPAYVEGDEQLEQTKVRSVIKMDSVTENDYPIVYFKEEDYLLMHSTICETKDGYLIIYSDVIPEEDCYIDKLLLFVK